MLHNSLYSRDLLKKMNGDPVVLARRDPHRNVARQPNAAAGAGRFLLEGAWAVHTSTGNPAEALVAKDACDFLHRMDIKPAESNASAPTLLLEVGSCDRGFRCVSQPGGIEIHAADAASLWAGWVHLENEMRSLGAPILAREEIMREPAWHVQIAPPSWGANYAVPDLSPEFLGDETFRSLAHQGVDGMFIYGDWLLYAKGTRFPELDHPDATKNIDVLRDANRRAAGYGIKLYFCAVSPKLFADHPAFLKHPSARGAVLKHEASSRSHGIHCLCSSDADALGFHADVLGNLFREVPQLGGLVLIIGGESFYHCFMRAAGAPIGRSNCPRCDGKLAEDVIAHLLDVVAEAVHRHQPAAHVAAWPYSASSFWSLDPNELPLIDRLPKGVALLSEIEKDQTIEKTTTAGQSYRKRIWDYSVDFIGPSDRIVAQALRSAQRDRELFIKTETSFGIELLHLPYVPSITRSAREWQHLRTLRPRGVLQRWGFVGMFDSAAERIGYQARWNPAYCPDEICLEVARQLCGPVVAGQIVRAWRAFDAAVSHIPILTTGSYYRGPGFLGPCHPLPVWTGPTPAAFRGNLYYLAEGEVTFAPPRPSSGDDLLLHSMAELGNDPPADIIEAEFIAARDLAAEGHHVLAELPLDSLPHGWNQEAREQQLIGEYLYRTFFTTVSTILFLRARDAKADHATLVSIARDELPNAQAARTLYLEAPWLNHCLRLDVGVPNSIAMLDEKIRQIELFVG